MPGYRATLREFAKGRLHSGSKTGPLVQSKKQAVAIAHSEKQKAPGSALHMAKRRLGY